MKYLTKWKDRTQGDKMIILLKSLCSALDTTDISKWRTDVWGIAKQFGGAMGVKREDFDMIKDMTAEQIADVIIEEKIFNQKLHKMFGGGKKKADDKNEKKPLTRNNISSVFETSELIATLDKKDPHYLLKVQNILKGYTHGVVAHENSSAIWRTENLTSPEEFKNFFKERVSAHGEMAEKWFTPELDNNKLRHFYQDAKKPKECTSHGKECRCWELK